jgi:electron transport complex protein RnfB
MVELKVLTPAQLVMADKIDAVLPQTQCRQCEFPDCRRYAEAIAAGEAEINQCPPGGEAGVAQLAALVGRAAMPLNPHHGVTKPFALAVIDEAVCIGCTLCIQACPVDAILGAPKLMHTVIAQECTGCELCIAPCPVDCIVMEPASAPPADRAQHWRQRHQFHLFRTARDKGERGARLAAKARAKLDDPYFQDSEKQAKMLTVLARNEHAADGDAALPSMTQEDIKAQERQAKLRAIMARATALRSEGREARENND